MQLSGQSLNKSDQLRSGAPHSRNRSQRWRWGHLIGHVVKPNVDRLRFQAIVNVIERGGDKVNGQ